MYILRVAFDAIFLVVTVFDHDLFVLVLVDSDFSSHHVRAIGRMFPLHIITSIGKKK